MFKVRTGFEHVSVNTRFHDLKIECLFKLSKVPREDLLVWNVKDGWEFSANSRNVRYHQYLFLMTIELAIQNTLKSMYSNLILWNDRWKKWKNISFWICLNVGFLFMWLGNFTKAILNGLNKLCMIYSISYWRILFNISHKSRWDYRVSKRKKL